MWGEPRGAERSGSYQITCSSGAGGTGGYLCILQGPQMALAFRPGILGEHSEPKPRIAALLYCKETPAMGIPRDS